MPLSLVESQLRGSRFRRPRWLLPLLVPAVLAAALGIARGQDGTQKLGALKAEVEGAEKGTARWQDASIRYGRLAFHLRKFATAKRVLTQFLEASSEHPEARAVREVLQNIAARFQVDRGTLGVLLPLSGKFERFGREVKRGIEVALDGLSNLKVEYVDTQGRPDLARKGVESLVLEHKVVALIGPVGQGEALAAAEAAEQYQVPIMTLTRRDDITSVGGFVFRNFLTNRLQGQAMARYAYQVLGLRKFAILHPSSQYGEENMRAFWDEVVKLGGQVTSVERYSATDKNHQEPVRKLVGSFWLELRPDIWKGGGSGSSFNARKKRWSRAMKNIKPIVDFDAIFIPDFAKNLVFVVPWLNYYDIELFTENVVRLDRMKLKYKGKIPKMVWLLGANGWNADYLHKRIGDFVWRAVFCDAIYRYSDEPAWTGFVNKYKDRFGVSPNFLAAVGYDSLRILHKAIIGANVPSREAARDELLKVKDFAGATGTTSFTTRDADKKLHILTIERSKQDVNKYQISPARQEPRDVASEEDGSRAPRIEDGAEGAQESDAEPAAPKRKKPVRNPEE